MMESAVAFAAISARTISRPSNAKVAMGLAIGVRYPTGEGTFQAPVLWLVSLVATTQ